MNNIQTARNESADIDSDSASRTKWDNLSNVAFAGKTEDQRDADIEKIYQQIENPLTIDSLKTIMNLYSDGSSNIYNCLEIINAEDKNYSKNTKDEEDFRESLYEDWLIHLRQMSKEDVQKAGGAFIVMGRYALSHPEIKTRQQLTESINSDRTFSSEQKESLVDLIKSKCYDHASKIGWDFARNCQIKPKHRLYMNVPQDDVYRLAQLVKNGCDESGVKYDFKLEDQAARADSFMMYLTDEMLGPTIKVLEQIESDYPEIIERLGKPPILSGKVNDWLGYGSEPEGSSDSFNGVRANVIQEVLDKHILDYAKRHGHDMTSATYNGKKLNLNQYIALQETNAFMKKLGDDYKRVKRRNEIQSSPNKSIKEELGYDAEQMRIGSPLYNMLANFYAARREIGETGALEYLRKNGATNLSRDQYLSDTINLSIGDNESRIVKERRPVSSRHGDFGMGTENKVFRQIILSGMTRDQDEINSIRNEILKNCGEKGIDSESFCFDKYVLSQS